MPIMINSPYAGENFRANVQTVYLLVWTSNFSTSTQIT